MSATDNAAETAGRRGAGPATAPAVSPADILDILGAALRDFRAAPAHDLALGGFYAVGGWLLALLLLVLDLPFLVYPLAAGFALVAPFVAAAFYAVSRILERGEIVTWRGIFASVRQAATSDIGWMALVTGFSLFIWMDIAALFFFGFLGFASAQLSLPSLLDLIFTTPKGLLFLALGHFVGAMIAFAVFSFSVTSFPMLFDRNVDFITAMITSVRVVAANRFFMILWCATIAALTGVSLLSGLIGLFVILPVLGHASWHLYRRLLPLDGPGADA
ncbi:MAG: DUF2189 domain-containing protein [Rhodospirillaceae bacterium]|nr:DUF2189 domain-containing protein [Rhodospirillaceae bacterium]